MNYFNKKNIEALCLVEGNRIPKELRIDKKAAIRFLKLIKNNEIEIKNSHVYSLASWAGFKIQKFNNNDVHSEIKKITLDSVVNTVDLCITNGESYVANGIICHNTVNLPKDAIEDMVAKVYLTGWESGCKGLTVYRDGCRDGVLISNKTTNASAEAEDNNAMKRPKVVSSDVMFFNNNNEKWVAVIGKVINGGNKERPYELFTGKLESFPIPNYVENGKVSRRKEEEEVLEIDEVTGVEKAVKKPKTIYDFSYVDKDGYEVIMQGISRSFDPEYWNYAKLISGLLRHKMPMQHLVSVIDSLNLNDDSLNTWKKGVIRILRKYISDGTKSKNKCPHCDAVLVMIEGCEKCQACGKHNKCG